MASALDAARTAIESEVSSTWASRTTIQWADRPFTQPAGPWLRVTILFGEAVTIATDLNQVTGLVQCDVFAISGDGLGTAIQYADDARLMLNNLEVSGVRFANASGPKPLNSRPDVQQLVVDVPFYLVEAV